MGQKNTPEGNHGERSSDWWQTKKWNGEQAKKATLDKISAKELSNRPTDVTQLLSTLIQYPLNRFVYQNAVVGIGLNVNQRHFDDLSNAISLKQIIGIEFPVEKVMEHICESLEARYLMLRSGYFKDLKKAYMSNLYGLNKLQSFIVDNKKLNGKIINVLRNGFLQIELIDGEIRDYDIKEIKFLSIVH